MIVRGGGDRYVARRDGLDDLPEWEQGCPRMYSRSDPL